MYSGLFGAGLEVSPFPDPAERFLPRHPEQLVLPRPEACSLALMPHPYFCRPGLRSASLLGPLSSQLSEHQLYCAGPTCPARRETLPRAFIPFPTSTPLTRLGFHEICMLFPTVLASLCLPGSSGRADKSGRGEPLFYLAVCPLPRGREGSPGWRIFMFEGSSRSESLPADRFSGWQGR